MEKTEIKTEEKEHSVTTTKDPSLARQVPFTWKSAFIDLFQRMTSRKLWMLLTSVLVMWLALERGVNHLYMLQPAQSGVYGGMFLAVVGVIGALVGKYMGIETSITAQTSVVGAITSAATNAFERREEKSEYTETIIDERARNENLRENQE